MNKKTILVIDGHHLLHKGYYGSIKKATVAKNHDGEVINAVYTFIANIKKLIEYNIYYNIIVAFDVENGSCWRKEIYPKYKSTRKKTPEDLRPQMKIVRKFLTEANISWYEKDGFEADDLIGTICRIGEKCDYNIHVYSNDKDIFQLVNENVKVITNQRKGEPLNMIDHQAVIDKFGCRPEQVPDMKALIGDPSDGIRGVKFLDESSAIELLSKYDNVEDIINNAHKIENEALRAKITLNKNHIATNKKITEILKNVDIGKINLKPLKIDWDGFLFFLKEQKMSKFVKDIQRKIDFSNRKGFRNYVRYSYEADATIDKVNEKMFQRLDLTKNK